MRNVKWVNKVVTSSKEAEGMWQRGVSYKGFSPSMKDLTALSSHDIDRAVAVQVKSYVLPLCPWVKGPS